jgi:hypothetical protein
LLKVRARAILRTGEVGPGGVKGQEPLGPLLLFPQGPEVLSDHEAPTQCMSAMTLARSHIYEWAAVGAIAEESCQNNPCRSNLENADLQAGTKNPLSDSCSLTSRKNGWRAGILPATIMTSDGRGEPRGAKPKRSACNAASTSASSRLRAGETKCTQTPEMHGPPMYFTPDWISARASVQILAALLPDVVVTGHGQAMQGPEMRMALQELAQRFEEIAVPQTGRYALNRIH